MGAFEARFSPRNASGPCIGAIDVGAGKVVCLVARLGGEGPIDVLGAGHVGLRADVEDDARPRLVRVALDQALRMAGDVWPPIGTAYGGPDLKSARATGAVRLRKGVVAPRDVAAAIAAARGEVSLAQRRLLHAAPLSYRVDDGEAVADPRGLEGRTLTADVCLVHAPTANIAALEAMLEAAGARPAFIVAAPFAAGYGVLSAEEREAGAVVIDLGEAGCGLGVFRAGALAWAEHSPGGGARLTRDLSVRLGTTVGIAERAKRLYGGLAGEHDPAEVIETPVLGEDGRLSPGVALRGAFAEALAPRLEEIFGRIAVRLEEAGAAELPVALTGGVSQTPGLRALAARVLARPVRIASPAGFGGLDEAHCGGAFATAAGLIRCGATRHAAPVAAKPAVTGPAPKPSPKPSPKPAAKPAAAPAPAQIDPAPDQVGAAAPVSVAAKARDAVAWIKENF